jgi:hypothetical protein
MVRPGRRRSPESDVQNDHFSSPSQLPGTGDLPIRQRPTTAHNARTIRASWGNVRPEKQTAEAGLPAPDPQRTGCRPRCFNPSLPTRQAAGSSLHERGGTP